MLFRSHRSAAVHADGGGDRAGHHQEEEQQPGGAAEDRVALRLAERFVQRLRGQQAPADLVEFFDRCFGDPGLYLMRERTEA